MLTVNVPERLTDIINEMAKQFCQTPEEYVIEMIEERLVHQSAYRETAYLAASKTNRDRLDRAIEDIRAGRHEFHELINQND